MLEKINKKIVIIIIIIIAIIVLAFFIGTKFSGFKILLKSSETNKITSEADASEKFNNIADDITSLSEELDSLTNSFSS